MFVAVAQQGITTGGIASAKLIGVRKLIFQQWMSRDGYAPTLKANTKAEAYFNTRSYSNKRKYVLPIGQAKAEETRQRRIEKAVSDLEAGKR